MDFKILVAMCAILAGCTTTDPLVRVETQVVNVPVAVACKEEMPNSPDYCFNKLTTDMDMYEKVRCLLSDRKLSLGYEIELVSKLKACR